MDSKYYFTKLLDSRTFNKGVDMEEKIKRADRLLVGIMIMNVLAFGWAVRQNIRLQRHITADNRPVVVQTAPTSWGTGITVPVDIQPALGYRVEQPTYNPQDTNQTQYQFNYFQTNGIKV